MLARGGGANVGPLVTPAAAAAATGNAGPTDAQSLLHQYLSHDVCVLSMQLTAAVWQHSTL